MHLRFCCSFFLSLLCLLSVSFPVAADSLSVLLYHNVSSSTPRSTSVSPEVFEQHLQSLQSEGFNVVDLPEAIAALQAGSALPEKAVAISFDDADKSIYQNAFPLLQQYDMPFTVFVNTEPVDKSYGRAMNWEMLREMHQAGAAIVNHTRDHDYMIRKPEHDDAWLASALEDIDYAQQRLVAELGDTPKLFAYPYGEYNNKLKLALAERDWIAFGQHSGAIDQHSDFTALPRFTAAGAYANWKGLRVKLGAKPLPVDYHALPDPVFRQEGAPELSVTFRESDNVRTDALRCYIQGDTLIPQWNESGSAFTVTATNALADGRTRYNCTTPAKRGGYYYWFSHQWIKG